MVHHHILGQSSVWSLGIDTQKFLAALVNIEWRKFKGVRKDIYPWIFFTEDEDRSDDGPGDRGGGGGGGVDDDGHALDDEDAVASVHSPQKHKKQTSKFMEGKSQGPGPGRVQSPDRRGGVEPQPYSAHLKLRQVDLKVNF